MSEQELPATRHPLSIESTFKIGSTRNINTLRILPGASSFPLIPHGSDELSHGQRGVQRGRQQAPCAGPGMMHVISQHFGMPRMLQTCAIPCSSQDDKDKASLRFLLCELSFHT